MSECGRCDGKGYYWESIDDERSDVKVSCYMCHVFCKLCDRHVKKTGHECKSGNNAKINKQSHPSI